MGLRWDIFPTIDAITVATKGRLGFDVAPVPKGPGGGSIATSSAPTRCSRGPANEALGWEWVKFNSTKEAHLFMGSGGACSPRSRRRRVARSS